MFIILYNSLNLKNTKSFLIDFINASTNGESYISFVWIKEWIIQYLRSFKEISKMIRSVRVSGDFTNKRLLSSNEFLWFFRTILRRLSFTIKRLFPNSNKELLFKSVLEDEVVLYYIFLIISNKSSTLEIEI
jgi:hypothetical protein